MSSVEIERHPRWWVELCAGYGQLVNDLDAFCFWPPDRLKAAVAEAKAEHGDELVDVEIDPDIY